MTSYNLRGDAWNCIAEQQSTLEGNAGNLMEASNCKVSNVPIPEAWNELRMQNVMCDGVLHSSDGVSFPVHRVIVSTAAEKIRRLFVREHKHGFEESSEATVPTTGKTLGLFVEYVYTGTCMLNVHTARNLLEFARQYEVDDLIQACCDFLEEEMTVENCIGNLKIASKCSLFELEIKTRRFICHMFSNILVSCPELWTLDPETLSSILSSDHLNVLKESGVFSAITQWVDYDPPNRLAELCRLVQNCVRCGLVKAEEFDDVILQNKYVQMNEILQNKFQCEYEYFKNNSSGSPTKETRFTVNGYNRPRIPYSIIFAIGGWSDGATTNFIETYDPRTDKWFQSSFLDYIPRAYHGVCVLNKIIYIIGGFDGREYFNSVRCFDPEKYYWSDRACMYNARCYVAVCISDGIIYALGGYDGRNRLCSGERYDPSTNQWTLLPDMQCVRSDASAASINKKVYIAGGYSGWEVLNSVEMYDPETNVWTLIQPLNSPRSGLSLLAIKDCLYAIGGFNSLDRLNSVEIYAPERSDDWTNIPPMPNTRSNFGAVFLDSKIYTIGGFEGVSVTSCVDCYDLNTNQWYTIQQIYLKRSALAACVVSGLSNAAEYSFLSHATEIYDDITPETIEEYD